MNIDELIAGVAVIIDDEVENNKANIGKIITQIKERRIPISCFKSIEEVDIDHLESISFLLLDWQLKPSIIGTENVTIGAKLLESMYSENIEFIRKLIEKSFCPIFIFSNEEISFIKIKLIETSLYYEGKPNRIFIKQKSEVENAGSLFSAIEQWYQDTPSMYVFRKWEYEQQKATKAFFNEFQLLSPYWPHAMWDCFKKDDTNQSLGLREIITRNVQNRIKPFEFDKQILNKEHPEIDKNELRQVLKGERFLSTEQLSPDDIGTGDLFKSPGGKYLLNIRAQCDLLRKENVILYCLKGVRLSPKHEPDDFLPKYGQYTESIAHVIIPFINNGEIVRFSFGEIEFCSFDEIKDKRIGRVLPPYITRVQQRFALYLQRQGLPRIPYEAIGSIVEQQSDDATVIM